MRTRLKWSIFRGLPKPIAMPYLLTLCLLLALYHPVFSQPAADPAPPAESIFRSFCNIPEDLPLLHLETDWKQLLRTKDREIYQDASLWWLDGQQDTVAFELRLRPRGNMRKVVCYYPPLRLKFKKKHLDKAGYAPAFNDVKMVIQCRDGEVGQHYLLREYLIYQMYNLLSPIAYNTRLIRVEMEDAGSRKPREALAFMIEKEDEFQDRIGGNVIEEGRISESLIDREAYVRMCFFQYLILNNDWSVYSKHNVEFIMMDSSSVVYPVPYDFDYSGWVQASYAVPPPQLPIKRVTEPYFRGQELTEEEVLAAAAFFQEKKDELYRTCSEFTYLDQREQKRITKLLDQFYRTLDNEKGLVRNFAGRE